MRIGIYSQCGYNESTILANPVVYWARHYGVEVCWYSEKHPERKCLFWPDYVTVHTAKQYDLKSWLKRVNPDTMIIYDPIGVKDLDTIVNNVKTIFVCVGYNDYSNKLKDIKIYKDYVNVLVHSKPLANYLKKTYDFANIVYTPWNAVYAVPSEVYEVNDPALAIYWPSWSDTVYDEEFITSLFSKEETLTTLCKHFWLTVIVDNKCKYLDLFKEAAAKHNVKILLIANKNVINHINFLAGNDVLIYPCIMSNHYLEAYIAKSFHLPIVGYKAGEIMALVNEDNRNLLIGTNTNVDANGFRIPSPGNEDRRRLLSTIIGLKDRRKSLLKIKTGNFNENMKVCSKLFTLWKQVFIES
jgi:hypothetical protein